MSVTRSDVAKHAGVSEATVSNVMNNVEGKVSQEVRGRVLKSVQELGYVPNESAKRLIEKRYADASASGNLTHNIGCIIYKGFNKFSNYIYAGIMEGVENEIRKNNYHLYFYYKSNELAESPVLFNKMINTDSVDGLITISTQLEDIREQVLSRIKNIISIGEPLGNTGNIDCIVFDEHQVGVDAVKYLAGLGHKSIGFVGVTQLTTNKRFLGYKDALKSLGLLYDGNIVKLNIEGKELSMRGLGYSNMRYILDSAGKAPTAVFVADDEASIGVYKAIMEKGLKIPDDISVLTCGNSSKLDDLEPGITSFVLKVDEVAVIAVKRLLERIKNPAIGPIKTTVPYRLVEHASCKKIQ